MAAINLWELMLSAGTNAACVPEYKQKQIQETCLALSRESYVAGQELTIEVVDNGWLIKVFSVYDDTWEVNFHVSKTGKVDLSVGRIEERALGGN